MSFVQMALPQFTPIPNRLLATASVGQKALVRHQLCNYKESEWATVPTSCRSRIPPTLDLTSQDPVLRRQIFVSQEEFLIDWSGGIGEQVCPKHPIISNFVKGRIVGAVS